MDETGKASAEARRDALWLVIIFLVSAAPYISSAGFYSDDWSILAEFHFAAVKDRSVLETAIAAFPGRPLHGLYAALLFESFGLDPLGYLLVNTAALAGAVAALHLLLIRMKFGRAPAFSATLIFLLLPQLTTVRIWFAAAQIPLALALALASLHAQLSFQRTRRPSWAIFAAGSALLSIFAYEIFAPVLLAFPVYLIVSQNAEPRIKWQRLLPALLFVVASAGILLFSKIAWTQRAGSLGSLNHYVWVVYQSIRPDYDWRIHGGLNVLAAAEIYFWHPFVAWGGASKAMLSGGANAVSVGSAAAAAAVVAWRLRKMQGSRKSFSSPLRLFIFGCATFVLGHAVFLMANDIMFSPAGMANRAMVAGAIGVAMIFAALLGWASNVLPSPYGKPALSVPLTFIAIVGILRTATVAEYWAQAHQIQQRVLSAARADLSSMPRGATIILDGVCPYHGPGVVFETNWDVSGALSMVLQRPIMGDVVSPRMTITPRGLSSSMYGEPSFYLYGPSLFVYNPSLHLVAPLSSAADARRYFARPDRWAETCGVSYVGHGELID